MDHANCYGIFAVIDKKDYRKTKMQHTICKIDYDKACLEKFNKCYKNLNKELHRTLPILISDIVEYRFGGRNERKIDEIEDVVSYLVKIMDEV